MAIDLMFASCGIEHEIVAAATPHPVPGVGVVPIVTREHLIALKVLSVRDARPQDKVDLMGLFAQSADVEIVQDALRKITAVGCNWEQDLLAKLDGLLRELAD